MNRKTLSLSLISSTLICVSAVQAQNAESEFKYLPPANPFCDAVYLAISGLSDYRFDGFSESNRSPTLQSNAHCFRKDGFYAGAVGTRVDFEDQPPTRWEVDYYVGRHLPFYGADLNIEVLYASFPTQRTMGPSYAILEPQVELTKRWGRFTLSQQVAWSPNYSGAGQAWHLKTGASVKLFPWLDASGHVGRLWIAHGFDRNHYDAGVTARWKRLSLDVRYGGTDLKRSQCYYTNWCAPGFASTLTYRLLP
jgi:uncharacterized protein (TIGR02001 family)